MIVVISQPMFIPWLGLFEQINLADVYVHYDDVQLPQGRSFMSRVQIKTETGPKWLSAPVEHSHGVGLINQTNLVADGKWRQQHLNRLDNAYRKAPYHALMMELAAKLYEFDSNRLSTFNEHAIETISDWLGLKTTFCRSSDLDIPGSSTARLIDICAYYSADIYVTGLGGLNYLDYSQFENRDIEVSFMKYEQLPYPQLHGEFSPFFTILDTIANCGKESNKLIMSRALSWRTFTHESD